MGKASRDKGAREERMTVNHWRSLNVNCMRVPLSGATDYAAGDIDLYVFGEDQAPWVLEQKVRANGFKQIYDWLGDFDGLVIKQSGKKRLYVIPEDKMEILVSKVEKG